MSLFHKEIDDISIKDIESLVEDGILESKTLEYKREFNFEKNSSKTEFLNDLTAMANSIGGDIIFGIEDCNGKPKMIGLSITNIDDTILRIESILRTGVTPQFKYEIRPLILVENTYLILIRIYKSFYSPHVVLSGGYGFYKRNQSGKHPMAIDELRECFMTSAGYSKEAYLFHLKDELEYNREVMDSIFSYIVENPPIKSAFEAVNSGSYHFRLEAWNAIVRAGLLPLLTFEQQKSFQEADKSIRDTARLIQMVNAEWKRILEFDDQSKKHNVLQPAPLEQVLKNKERYIKELIDSGRKSIDKAISAIGQ